MVFTTQVFLFFYMPVCVAAYILAGWLEKWGRLGSALSRLRVRDLVLICLSLGFYMWACLQDVFRLVLYIGMVYLLALWIQSSRSKGHFIRLEAESPDGQIVVHKRIYAAAVPLALAVAAVLFVLGYYKYYNITVRIWDLVFRDDIGQKTLLAPLGISFITFSAISYLADVYRGKATAGSLIDCALYLSFFPKVVSGPIVLWADFQKQIGSRKTTFALSARGLDRIMAGFAKKVLLADTFGACIAQAGTQGIDRVTAAGTVLLYMLQIYYDFSGYSDIALGLSALFGFEFKENFCFPYRSTSISEFWRRWHISLGAWFREYVYFPLGGSRTGRRRTLVNLSVVFALTGIWHGAGWTYILWGFINGAFVVLERVVQDRPAYRKTPKWIKYGCTMLIVMLFWQLFRFQSLRDVAKLFAVILGMADTGDVVCTWRYFFDAQLIAFTAAGIIGATLLGSPRVARLYAKWSARPVGYALQEVVLLALFVLSILFMINSTYSPFIYFQY